MLSKRSRELREVKKEAGFPSKDIKTREPLINWLSFAGAENVRVECLRGDDVEVGHQEEGGVEGLRVLRELDPQQGRSHADLEGVDQAPQQVHRGATIGERSWD